VEVPLRSDRREGGSRPAAWPSRRLLEVDTPDAAGHSGLGAAAENVGQYRTTSRLGLAGHFELRGGTTT